MQASAFEFQYILFRSDDKLPDYDEMMSQFNGTSTPKGSCRAKTGDNDSNVNSIRYGLRTALCESIRYQAKSEQNVLQYLIPRVRHREAALMHPKLPGYRNNVLHSQDGMDLKSESI